MGGDARGALPCRFKLRGLVSRGSRGRPRSRRSRRSRRRSPPRRRHCRSDPLSAGGVNRIGADDHDPPRRSRRYRCPSKPLGTASPPPPPPLKAPLPPIPVKAPALPPAPLPRPAETAARTGPADTACTESSFAPGRHAVRAGGGAQDAGSPGNARRPHAVGQSQGWSAPSCRSGPARRAKPIPSAAATGVRSPSGSGLALRVRRGQRIWPHSAPAPAPGALHGFARLDAKERALIDAVKGFQGASPACPTGCAWCCSSEPGSAWVVPTAAPPWPATCA